jgi:hypothetical protein
MPRTAWIKKRMKMVKMMIVIVDGGRRRRRLQAKLLSYCICPHPYMTSVIPPGWERKKKGGMGK